MRACVWSVRRSVISRYLDTLNDKITILLVKSTGVEGKVWYGQVKLESLIAD